MKALDGVNQQTLTGALLTIVGAILVIVLLVTEVSIFRDINVVNKLVVDKAASTEAVKLMFDVTFHRVSCDRLSFMQEATRGTIHSHDPVEMLKVDVDDATTPGRKGCRVSGFGIIDKIAGNFRFAVSSQNNAASDLSHTINFVSFVPTSGKLAVGKIPDASSNISQVSVSVPDTTVIYQYSMQIIPTLYRELWGEVYYMNQYSLSEKSLTLDQARRGDPFFPVPVRDFFGLLFTYDFHPVSLPISR